MTPLPMSSKRRCCKRAGTEGGWRTQARTCTGPVPWLPAPCRYEDYLDNQITATDMFYLENVELARQLVELG